MEQVEEAERAGRSAAPVSVGQRVRVGQGSIGVVQEIRPDGKLMVLVGVMRMLVDPATVAPVGNEPVPETRVPRRSPAAQVDRESPSEVDLRGMTGEEAESAAMAAVDTAFSPNGLTFVSFMAWELEWSASEYAGWWPTTGGSPSSALPRPTRVGLE